MLNAFSCLHRLVKYYWSGMTNIAGLVVVVQGASFGTDRQLYATISQDVGIEIGIQQLWMQRVEGHHKGQRVIQFGIFQTSFREITHPKIEPVYRPQNHGVTANDKTLVPEMRSFENQSFIIRSHAMVLRAVNRLDFGVSYFSKGRLKDTELYDPLPFVVAFDSLHPQLLNTNFNANVLADGRIQLSVRAEGGPLHNYDKASNVGHSGPVVFDQVVQAGEAVQHSAFSFRIKAAPGRSAPVPGTYMFRFNSHSAIASSLRGALNVAPYREGSSIIFISTTGQQPQKLVRFLNTFSEEVIDNNLERKNNMANRSIEFIQRQLVQVADTLKVTQQKLMDFRRENRFMMPSEMSSRLSEEFFEYEREQRLMEVSLTYLSDLHQRLSTNDLDDNDYLLPAFSSEPAALIQSVVKEHIDLLKEAALVAAESGGNNPYRLELARKIEMSQSSLLIAIEKQM